MSDPRNSDAGHSSIEKTSIGKTAIEKTSAHILAKSLAAKQQSELRAVANSSPALVREWIAELAAAQEQSKRELELFHAALDQLRTAEHARIRDVAA